MSDYPALAPVSHWTPARKAAVVLAIARGEITEAEAMAAHALTEDELSSWVWRHAHHGERGLRVTTLQETRVA